MRWFAVLAKLILVGVCLAYVLWNIEPAHVVLVLANIDVRLVAVTFLVSLLGYLVVAARLCFLSHGQATFTTCLAATLLGLGINNLLPAKLGEVAKMLYLRLRSGIAFSEAALVVGWERFFDVNMLVVIAIASAWPYLRDTLLLPLTALLVLAWVGAWAALRFARQVRGWMGRIPLLKLRGFLLEVHAHLDARMVRGRLATAACMTILVWFTYASTTLLMLLWVFDFGLEFHQAVVVFVVAASGMALPSSPGALGVYEAAVVLALSWFGIGREQALAAALALHALQYIPTTLMGLVVLSRTPLRLGRLMRPRVA